MCFAASEPEISVFPWHLACLCLGVLLFGITGNKSRWTCIYFHMQATVESCACRCVHPLCVLSAVGVSYSSTVTSLIAALEALMSWSLGTVPTCDWKGFTEPTLDSLCHEKNPFWVSWNLCDDRETAPSPSWNGSSVIADSNNNENNVRSAGLYLAAAATAWQTRLIAVLRFGWLIAPLQLHTGLAAAQK